MDEGQPIISFAATKGERIEIRIGGQDIPPCPGEGYVLHRPLAAGGEFKWFKSVGSEPPPKRGFVDITTDMMHRFTLPSGMRMIGSADCTGMGVIRLVIEGDALPARQCRVVFEREGSVVTQRIVGGYGRR